MPFFSLQRVRPYFLQAFAGLLWALLLAPSQSFAADLDVLLILSGNAPPYQEFAATFRRNLPAGIQVSQLELGQLENTDALSRIEQKTGLVVTVGLKAGEWVVPRTNKPVLAAMLPSYKYAGIRANHHSGEPISAIFVDQPWSRQVSLVRAALPEYKRIGLLYMSEDVPEMTKLRTLLEQEGATLVTKKIDPAASLYVNLNGVLSQSDVLLAVPDSAIYNSDNIRNILLSSYRQRVPLIGLSQAYVDAGALCAVYSTPQDLAEQASADAAGFARDRRLPDAQFPRFYNVAVNREVAMMLGIRIHSAPRLKLLIEQAEK
jgi:ABC-type uncharacterized transport system substrate-binding protein